MIGPPLLRCPRCRNPNVDPLPRTGIGDHLAALFRRRPFLCRWCRRRFRVRTTGIVLLAQAAAERELGTPAAPGS